MHFRVARVHREREWSIIRRRSATDARIIWRSNKIFKHAPRFPDFIDRITKDSMLYVYEKKRYTQCAKLLCDLAERKKKLMYILFSTIHSMCLLPLENFLLQRKINEITTIGWKWKNVQNRYENENNDDSIHIIIN